MCFKLEQKHRTGRSQTEPEPRIQEEICSSQ